jgi:hypothetical protein
MNVTATSHPICGLLTLTDMVAEVNVLFPSSSGPSSASAKTTYPVFKSSAKRKSIPNAWSAASIYLCLWPKTKQHRQSHPDPQSRGVAMEKKGW